MSPQGYVPDPNSPEAWAARLQAIEQQIAQLKQSPVATVLGYAAQATPQTGITSAAITDITGLAVKALVGTRRLVKITGLVVAQKHVTKATGQLRAYDTAIGNNPGINKTTFSMDGTTDDYATLLVIAIDSAPAAGTHTYQLAIDCSSGTIDANQGGTGHPSYILVEDVGLAPA